MGVQDKGSSAGEGDPRLDGKTYRQYLDELVLFATVLVGPADAQDVVAEATARCLDKADWSRVENPRAYLYRAVLNYARSLHRANSRRRRLERRVAGRFGQTSSSDQQVSSDASDTRVDVLGALGCLSTRQRAVVYATYWEDLTPRDVARLLGISEGAVKRHLTRARRRLRELLK